MSVWVAFFMQPQAWLLWTILFFVAVRLVVAGGHLSKPKIIRCLRRCLTREPYRTVVRPPASLPRPTNRGSASPVSVLACWQPVDASGCGLLQTWSGFTANYRRTDTRTITLGIRWSATTGTGLPPALAYRATSVRMAHNNRVRGGVRGRVPTPASDRDKPGGPRRLRAPGDSGTGEPASVSSGGGRSRSGTAGETPTDAAGAGPTRNERALSDPSGYPGAEDGIRTRDPHLGKVMLYH